MKAQPRAHGRFAQSNKPKPTVKEPAQAAHAHEHEVSNT
jgi:hypothetical protein